MSQHWIEVDTDALAANMRCFRGLVGDDVVLAPVIKANGYGHGLELAAAAFLEGGADWLCVHAADEARRAREVAPETTILQLGPVDPDEAEWALRAGIHLTVSEPARLSALIELARSLGLVAHVHIKVETGTWRQGVEGERYTAMLGMLDGETCVRFEGLHSHFANIEDTTRHDFAASQLARYQVLLDEAKAAGCVPRHRHIASSAAALLFPHTHLDLVRPGIASYGYWPSRETLVSAGSDPAGLPQLQPALTWKSRLTEIKPVPAGSYIGYGCTDKVEVETRLAIVPVGYADGYRRAMGGRAHVLVRGRRCPVRGRICMNLIMVDVGHVADAQPGDEVVLLGRQGGEELGAETLADWAQTLHYEVLAGLSPLIPRRSA